MKTRLLAQLSLALLALALPAVAGSEVTGEIVNDKGKCRYTVHGKATHLPNGTALHVTLSIQNVRPAVEAAFFRVTVVDGDYLGTQEWVDRSFAPNVYVTNVALHMDSQPPGVKAILQRELGYTQDHIEPVASADTTIGTAEEIAAHTKATLVCLRGLLERVEAFRTSLAAHTAKPIAEVPDWEAFCAKLGTDLDAAIAEFDQTFNAHVVWSQALMFSEISGSLGELFRLKDQHAQGDRAVNRRLNAMQQRLARVKADIDSRLPVEPQR